MMAEASTQEPKQFEEGHPALRLVGEPTRRWIIGGLIPLDEAEMEVVVDDLLRLDEQVQTGQLDRDPEALSWAMRFVRTVEATFEPSLMEN